MPRILGVDIPNNKSAYISLTYLYGIGPFLSVQICYELGINPHVRAGELTEDEVSRITNHLTRTTRWKVRCAGRCSRKLAG